MKKTFVTNLGIHFQARTPAAVKPAPKRGLLTNAPAQVLLRESHVRARVLDLVSQVCHCAVKTFIFLIYIIYFPRFFPPYLILYTFQVTLLQVYENCADSQQEASYSFVADDQVFIWHHTVPACTYLLVH